MPAAVTWTREEIMRRVRIDSEAGCWVWQGTKDRTGYGKLASRRKPWLAHRFVYTMLVGQVPAGLTLDLTGGNAYVWRRPDGRTMRQCRRCGPAKSRRYLERKAGTRETAGA